MNPLKKLGEFKDGLLRRSHEYEIHLTVVLVVIALVLLWIACFGEPEHKAIATLYIVL